MPCAKASLRILILSLAAALWWWDARAQVFEPDTFTLDNGLRVVVVSDHRVPVVTHMVWYGVGAAHEPPGLSGIAHFLEHMMFKGTETVEPGVFSREVARIGGRENAFTSYDFTGYFQTVSRDYLEMVMRLEADRMTNLTITPEQVEVERQVILEERRQRVDNNPPAILAELADAALFLNAPYRRPVIGWEHEIEAISRDDLLAFYRDWYSPANAVLVVVGDITADDLRPMAERHYGIIPSGDVPAWQFPQEPPHAGPRHAELFDERVQEPVWSRTYLVPSYRSGVSAGEAAASERLAYPLQVAVRILGGGPTSRLYQRLVVQDGLAVTAGAFYSPTVLGPARFVVHARPRPGVTLEQIEAAVEAVLAEILDSGFTEVEVDRAKRRLLADAVFARDSADTAAQVLGQTLAIGLSVEDVEAWPERIGRVTLEEAGAALGVVIDRNRSVTTWLRPASGSAAAL
ncbi:MAG: insulinase family protein [Rhodospirillales bacterium]|nr:MAG: insulinase family protein [Rhodospirillales bacterium]